MRTLTGTMLAFVLLNGLTGCRTTDRWQIRASLTRHLRTAIAGTANDYLNRYGQYSYAAAGDDEKPELIEVRNVILTDASIQFPPGGGADAKVSWKCEYRSTKEYEQKLEELRERIEGESSDSWNYASTADRDLYQILKDSHAPKWREMVAFALRDDQEKHDEEQAEKQETAAKSKGKTKPSEGTDPRGDGEDRFRKLRDEIRNRTVSFRLRHYDKTGWRVES